MGPLADASFSSEASSWTNPHSASGRNRILSWTSFNCEAPSANALPGIV